MGSLNKSRIARNERAGAKGSIPVGLGADWDALAVGTDGYILTADSSRPEGVRWNEPDQLDAADAGTANGATVVATEYGDGIIHKTVLTLDSTPVTFTDDAGAGQFGGVKLYDMPAGNIMVLGAVIDADVTLNETWWVDTIAGDVGVGSSLVDDGDALATTEQNIIVTTAVAALAAQAGPINAQSTAAFVSQAAGTTDLDVDINVRIDDSAAHMPDIVTNGAFGSDTGWTKGTGWTIAVGTAASDGSQSADSDLSQTAATLVDGIEYIVTYTITAAAGSLQPVLGGTEGTARSTSDTFTENIVAGADGTIVFRADADFVGTLDDVIITPLTGSGTISGSVTLTWINLGDF